MAFDKNTKVKVKKKAFKPPKGFGSGPPSLNETDDEGDGHKQTGGKSGVAQKDMLAQRKAQRGPPQDPFEELMAAASKNARFSPPQYPGMPQGVVDPNDPANATSSEIDNMPKKRKLA